MHFHLPIFIHSYIFLSLHTYTTPKYARHPLNPRPIHIGAQYHRTPIPTPTHTRRSLKGSYGPLRRPYTSRLHNLSSSFQTLKTFTVQLSACYSAQLLRNPALHLHLVYIISTPTPVHPDQPTHQACASRRIHAPAYANDICLHSSSSLNSGNPHTQNCTSARPGAGGRPRVCSSLGRIINSRFMADALLSPTQVSHECTPSHPHSQVHAHSGMRVSNYSCHRSLPVHTSARQLPS